MIAGARLIRFPDWPERLSRFLASCQSRKFEYGVFDCCLFAADAVLAMTGEDIAASFRGTYHSRREALRLARPSLGAFFEKQLALLPSVNPLMAQRGDLVMLERGDDHSLGIVALNGRTILKPSDFGVGQMANESAKKAWHV